MSFINVKATKTLQVIVTGYPSSPVVHGSMLVLKGEVLACRALVLVTNEVGYLLIFRLLDG